jgi:hypothetical protein
LRNRDAAGCRIVGTRFQKAPLARQLFQAVLARAIRPKRGASTPGGGDNARGERGI